MATILARAPKPKTPRVGRPPGKFTQSARFDRLRNLLEKEPAGVEISGIANALRITERSVRRYLVALSKKIALESLPTTPGGPLRWRIKPGERGRAVTLRRTQAFALLSARHVFDTWRGSALFEELEIALTEIRAVGGRAVKRGSIVETVADVHLDDRFFFLPPPTRSFASRGDDLDALFQSVAMLEPLSLRVKKTAGERPPRIVVHPYAVVAHAGTLFIVGPEAGKDDVEVIALDATSDLRPLEKNRFFLPAEFDLSTYLHGAFGVGKPARERVVVEFDARVADEVRSKKVHPAQRLGTSRDGRLRLSFPFANPDAVASFVLGFGDFAHVVEPAHFADEIAARLDRAARRYTIPAPLTDATSLPRTAPDR